MNKLEEIIKSDQIGLNRIFGKEKKVSVKIKKLLYG